MYNISLKHFETWSGKVGAPRIAVKPHLLDVINKARSQWLQLLYGLPMLDEHKEKLRSHRAALTDDFKILCAGIISVVDYINSTAPSVARVLSQ